jgi:hypothetical protein
MQVCKWAVKAGGGGGLVEARYPGRGGDNSSASPSLTMQSWHRAAGSCLTAHASCDTP